MFMVHRMLSWWKRSFQMVDRYTFRREFTDMYGQTKTVEHTMEGETLPEILKDFLYFLNGCSFSYVKDLVYVKEDGSEEAVIDWKTYDIEEVVDLQSELDFLETKINGC